MESSFFLKLFFTTSNLPPFNLQLPNVVSTCYDPRVHSCQMASLYGYGVHKIKIQRFSRSIFNVENRPWVHFQRWVHFPRYTGKKLTLSYLCLKILLMKYLQWHNDHIKIIIFLQFCDASKICSSTNKSTI